MTPEESEKDLRLASLRPWREVLTDVSLGQRFWPWLRLSACTRACLEAGAQPRRSRDLEEQLVAFETVQSGALGVTTDLAPTQS